MREKELKERQLGSEINIIQEKNLDLEVKCQEFEIEKNKIEKANERALESNRIVTQ